jgi:hypothetical protein
MRALTVGYLRLAVRKERIIFKEFDACKQHYVYLRCFNGTLSVVELLLVIASQSPFPADGVFSLDSQQFYFQHGLSIEKMPRLETLDGWLTGSYGRLAG